MRKCLENNKYQEELLKDDLISEKQYLLRNEN